jgi:hypothetical protein
MSGFHKNSPFFLWTAIEQVCMDIDDFDQLGQIRALSECAHKRHEAALPRIQFRDPRVAIAQHKFMV